MQSFIKSDMETVRARIKKPTITAILFFMALVINVIFVRHHMGYFFTHELLGSIVTSFMIGGLWYGKKIVAEAGKPPIDEETGEELHPGGVSGTTFRLALAVAVGATVGAVFFAIDAIRVIYNMVRKEKN